MPVSLGFLMILDRRPKRSHHRVYIENIQEKNKEKTERDDRADVRENEVGDISHRLFTKSPFFNLRLNTPFLLGFFNIFPIQTNPRHLRGQPRQATKICTFATFSPSPDNLFFIDHGFHPQIAKYAFSLGFLKIGFILTPEKIISSRLKKVTPKRRFRPQKFVLFRHFGSPMRQKRVFAPQVAFCRPERWS
jgi:hypothetical protein